MAQGWRVIVGAGTTAGTNAVEARKGLLHPRNNRCIVRLLQTYTARTNRAMSAMTRNILRNWSRRKFRRDSQVLSEWEVLGAEYWRGAAPKRESEASADQPYTAARNTFREIQVRWQESGEPNEGTLSEEYKAAELAFR